ncbi:hypothetical protein ACH5RR_004318 [Cinchona calisaya]|uniref:Polygalacturonase n=1 Tax=Cinchona calisaya TaxID=153742 RepID=A0ABD3AY51_9GENT
MFSLMIDIGSISPDFAPSNITGDSDVIYNVLDYGAVSDDKTDNSQAFLKAWSAACNAETGTPKVVVPENLGFLVYPVIFQGPCKPQNIEFLISGTIVAPSSPSIWDQGDVGQWLAFSRINGLSVHGFGTINGRGKGWWDQSCKLHPELALKFIGCNDSRLSNILFTNSPQVHVDITGSYGFSVHKLIIQSPGDAAPNTDGIHIQASHNLSITNSTISSGDDCISIGDYTSDIEVAYVECGPGHGISIGSLGQSGNFAQVENIIVTNCLLNGTTNGARIKTWQVGKGYVRNVVFKNLEFIGVKNPIIIDQNYCQVRGACPELDTGVHISNVTYNTMSGTSSSKIAINLNCSRSFPCSEISMEAIHLESVTPGNQVTASCTNAYGQEIDVLPGPCLQHMSIMK